MSIETTFAAAYDGALELAAREGKLSNVDSMGTMPVQPATNDLFRENTIIGGNETIIRDPGRNFLTIDGANVTVQNPHELPSYVDFTDDKGGWLTYDAGQESGAVIAEQGNNTFNDAHGGSFAFVSGSGDDYVRAGNSSGHLAIDAGAGHNTIELGSGSSYVRSEGFDTIQAGSGAVQVDAGAGSVMRFISAVGGTAVVNAGASTQSVAFGAAGATLHYTGAGTVTSDGGTETLDGSANPYSNAMYVNNEVSGITTLRAGSGNVTLVAGLGQQTLVGGSGHDIFDIAQNGTQGAALITIQDFTSKDTVGLYGYGANEVATALKTATMSGGNTTIILGDKTSVTFANTTTLNAHQFIGDK